MCGIFCSIRRRHLKCSDSDHSDYVRYKCALGRRGPDYSGERFENLSPDWSGAFMTSVLWMQGRRLVEQPRVDSDGNILLWNGDIFSGPLAGTDTSDTERLSEALCTSRNVSKTLGLVKGPYSIVYYQAREKRLHFARDPIGRHSLLLRANRDEITLSSVASGHLDNVVELPAIGIFSFDFENSYLAFRPWFPVEFSAEKSSIECLENRLGIEIVVLDPVYPEKPIFPIAEPGPEDSKKIDRVSSISVITDEEAKTRNRENIFGEVTRRLSVLPEVQEKIKCVLQLLRASMRVRIERKCDYCRNCVRSILRGETLTCGHPKVGILFSGGLDSTLLAAIAHEFIPADESIDLVNVAFEKASKSATKKPEAESASSAMFDVPDRKTGRQAIDELRRICPSRTWNFVECNVTRQELSEFRSSRIRDLVHPRSTVLDDGLGCALWFASRATGTLLSTGKKYDSPSRVLLVGMGADELFGGYTRHRTSLRHGGWSALSRELKAELARISERNLGRDDRVVSDHGRQLRLPYLDEDFVEYVSGLKAWERCQLTETMPAGLGDKLLLRLAAHEIGLHQTANFPKRAFQFGSRIANSREIASDASKWL